MGRNEETPISRILNLCLGVVLRSEEDYQKYYDHRRTRLREQRPDSVMLGALFDAAIEQTDSANDKASALTAACNKVIEVAPKTDREAIERVNQKMQKVSEKTLTQQSELVTKSVNEMQNKAFQYFSEIILTPHDNPDEFLKDAIDAAIAGETEFDRPLIQLRIALLWKQYEALGSHIKIGFMLRELSALYRGVLYSGIMNEFGDDIDRRELKNAIDSLGKATVDEVFPVPLKGVFEAIISVFVLVLGIGGKPEPIQQAESVENYINDYCGILEGWMQAAETVHHALVEIARVIESA